MNTTPLRSRDWGVPGWTGARSHTPPREGRRFQSGARARDEKPFRQIERVPSRLRPVFQGHGALSAGAQSKLRTSPRLSAVGVVSDALVRVAAGVVQPVAW